jgi:iron-sulfur cluster repair protein YtfE (RIC family)
MQPSEVRRRILADHERLRRDLERLEALANEILQDLHPPLATLRVDAERLLARLRAHMHWEESYLLPALREADAWGVERAERLTRDHREQRELLDFVMVRLRDATRPAAIVAGDVCHLVELLREDMREEEQELLDERVLRDDIVAIAVETG